MEKLRKQMENSENQETELSTQLLQREIGARVLNLSGFRGRHQETVDNSFNRARKRGEKLAGKNNERRVDAYLERIDQGISRHGDRLEQRLWDATKNSLIIQAEDIPESYWRTQEQILRDEGYGDIRIDEREKNFYLAEIQDKQRETISAWTDYLSHEDCPYPTWFKVYAIDGVSKMGVFDKSKGYFKKRDKSSVAPYPHFNSAVLGKVYSAIADFYGIDTGQDLAVGEDEAHPSRDLELATLIKSGNFNRLYSRLLLSEKVIAETPERAEDVQGEWIEYGAGQEEEIAAAADGTPWCVASPSVAGSYLATGNYGNYYDENAESRAKFILFHLKDADGRLADNACASIRLDTEGNVAEISGLKDGQALEDALVPVVEEKVRTLPGGEKFLRRLADKRRLIAIDRKMQAGEDISRDDFRFIYELDRPIETLDTYNSHDPRIAEFKKAYDSTYAAEHGYIIPETKLEDIKGALELYLRNDPELTSNLLVLALKQQLEDDPDKTKRIIGSTSADSAATAERIRSLETYETENYIFMLPTDVWERDKIALPGDPERRALAPEDLTAVLKAPVDFDWDYETDGEVSNWGVDRVYGEEWVGREVQYFPYSKELIAAQEELLKPHGYKIPSDWKVITDGLRRQLASERGISVNDIRGDDLSEALQNRLGMKLSGYFYDGSALGQGSSGYFWSTTRYSGYGMYSLGVNSSGVYPQNSSNRSYGFSVRCVRQ